MLKFHFLLDNMKLWIFQQLVNAGGTIWMKDGLLPLSGYRSLFLQYIFGIFFRSYVLKYFIIQFNKNY